MPSIIRKSSNKGQRCGGGHRVRGKTVTDYSMQGIVLRSAYMKAIRPQRQR